MRERLGCAVYAVVSQSVVALPLYVFCDYESEVKNQLFFCSSLLKSERTWLHPGSSDLFHVDDDELMLNVLRCHLTY